MPDTSLRKISRRAILASPAGLGLAGPAVAAAPPDGRTSLHQEQDYRAPPARFYQALLSSKTFAAFSRQPAQIDPRVGGRFSLFGGRVVGVNVELVPNRRIVQAWRVPEDFAAGVYSLVRFELSQTRDGTHVTLDQTGFPPGHYEHLYKGWIAQYFAPLHALLDKAGAA